MNATGQEPDFLIVQADTFYLFSNPLEPYLSYKDSRTINGVELVFTSTGCWRGYIATWKIQNDSLFLVKIETEHSSDTVRSFNLKEEFGSDKVFAAWFTGKLYSPRGNRLSYVHMGYGSIFEKEENYFVWNGLIKSKESKSNIVFNKNLLNPSPKFIIDTLKRIIQSKINREQIKEIPDSSVCRLHVNYNEEGKIKSIMLGGKKNEFSIFGNIILKIAQEEFILIPPLMSVTHKNYSPPSFDIFFQAKDLKKQYYLKN